MALYFCLITTKLKFVTKMLINTVTKNRKGMIPNTYRRANPVSRLIWKNVDCWGKKRKKVSWNSPGGTSTMCLKSWLLVERFSGIRSTQSWRAGIPNQIFSRDSVLHETFSISYTTIANGTYMGSVL